MPLYDYTCVECGAFELWVAMADAGKSQPCPGCGAPAARALARPHLRCGGAVVRYKAEAHNERSANEPQVVRHVGHMGSHKDRHGHEKGDHAHKRRSHRPWMVGH